MLFCQGKQSFNTPQRAKKVSHRLANGHGAKISPYRCPVCHGWHIGSKVGNQKKPSKHLKAALA